MNDSLKRDFNSICDDFYNWDLFRNKTFLVTGATGLLGSLFIKSLLYTSDIHKLDARVIAVVRDLEKGHKVFEEYNQIEFLVHDFSLDEPFTCVANVDYIIHTAAVTVSREMVSHPVENIKVSLYGTMRILDFAIKANPECLLYLSSMEAYGQMSVTDHFVEEHDLGRIDLSSVRSCYPEGKRMCECICKSYSNQHGIRVVVARLAQTFGPGISKEENRVFAQFAKSAIRGEDIVLHTKGESEGNYVYTADAIKAMYLLLDKGTSGEVYNVVNEKTHMSISSMAHMVADEIANGNIDVVFDLPVSTTNSIYAADTKMHLSSRKLQELGWEPSVNLLDMYKNMIRYAGEEELW